VIGIWVLIPRGATTGPGSPSGFERGGQRLPEGVRRTGTASLGSGRDGDVRGLTIVRGAQNAMEPEVQALIDRHAIEDVLARYARTLDWLDADAHATCYWPDADIDYGFVQTTGAGFIEPVMAVELGVKRRWHMLSPAAIRIDGARASVESYGMAVSAVDQDGKLVDAFFGGRYLDEFEKRDGQWRIAKRRFILDWSTRAEDIMAEVTSGDFKLNILEITAPGHPDYRKL